MYLPDYDVGDYLALLPPSYHPGSADEFLTTLERAFNAGGVHLIDLAIDYSDNHRILNEDIPRLSAAV